MRRPPISTLFPSTTLFRSALQVVTAPVPPRLTPLKQEAVRDVETRAQFTQQMVDQIFSFGELGFQETETSHYLVDLLRKNGDRKSTRLNSSHLVISYAVFC